MIAVEAISLRVLSVLRLPLLELAQLFKRLLRILGIVVNISSAYHVLLTYLVRLMLLVRTCSKTPWNAKGLLVYGIQGVHEVIGHHGIISAQDVELANVEEQHGHGALVVIV